MPDRRHRRSTIGGLAPLMRLAPLWAGGSVLLLVIGRQQRIPRDQLLLDPTSYGGLPWYAGLVSNLGILGWTAATATALLGSRLAGLGQRPAANRLLAGGATLSALLTLDDLFQLHIVVGEVLGWSKLVVYLGYTGLLAMWIAANRAEMPRTPLPLLVAAAAALGSSAVIDRFGGHTIDWLVAEDACKFLGIVAWALYFWETAGAVGRSLVVATGADGHPDRPDDGPDGPAAMSHRTLSAGSGHR